MYPFCTMFLYNYVIRYIFFKSYNYCLYIDRYHIMQLSFLYNVMVHCFVLKFASLNHYKLLVYVILLNAAVEYFLTEL